MFQCQCIYETMETHMLTSVNMEYHEEIQSYTLHSTIAHSNRGRLSEGVNYVCEF